MPVGERPVEDVPVEALPFERRSRDRRGDLSERSLRGLVTTRGTQIGWSAGIRARDAAAPTAADLAEAEAELVIIRRNYLPAEPLRNTRPQ